MVRSGEPRSSEPLRVSDLVRLLPQLPELGALIDLIASGSLADPDRRWTGSGELGALGNRMVDPSSVAEAASSLAAAEGERLARLYERASAIVRALAAGSWDEALELMIRQGSEDEDAGRLREAGASYIAAAEIARNRGHDRTAEALRLAARTARGRGDLSDAASRYEEAWNVAERTGASADSITAGIGRGNVAVDRGRWDEARTWYERALALIGESGSPRSERWQVLQNLAIVARRSGDTASARILLERAEEEGLRLDDPDARVEIGNGWGQLLLAEGDPRGAELYFERALEEATQQRARAAIGVNLGEALLRQGRALEAGERGREAEAIAITSQVTAKLPEIYRLLAGVAAARGEGDAFVLLEQALSIVRERNLPPFEEAATREAYGELRLDEGDRERGVSEIEVAVEIYASLGALGDVERLRARIAAISSGGDSEHDLTSRNKRGGNA